MQLVWSVNQQAIPEIINSYECCRTIHHVTAVSIPAASLRLLISRELFDSTVLMDSCSCPADLILENVRVSEQILGVCRPTRATYTSETIGGLRCAVKKFTDHQSIDQSGLFRTFIDGCKRWSQMRHPNIQQIMGVYVDQDGVPAVVTELLPFNLASFLEQSVSQSLKYCLLLDVARGLQYLHTRNPPIAHRNVTASNILVTSGLQGKLTDLAVSDCGKSPACDIQADISAFGRIIHLVVCSNPLDQCTSVSANYKQIAEHGKQQDYSDSLHNLSLKCVCDDKSETLSINVIVEEIKAAANSFLSTNPMNIAFPSEELSSVKDRLVVAESQISMLRKTVEIQQETLQDHQRNKMLLEQERDGNILTIEAQKKQIEYYKQLLQAKDMELQAQQQVLNSKQGQLKIKEREVVCATQDLSSKESVVALANTRIRALEHQLQTLKNKHSRPASPSLSMDSTLVNQLYAGGSDESLNVAQTTEGQELANPEQIYAAEGPDLLKRRNRSRIDRLTTLSDGITLSDWMMVKGMQRDTAAPLEDTEPKLTSLLARQLKKIDENTIDEQKLEAGITKKDLVPTEPPQPAVVMRRKKSVTQEADPQLQKLLTKRRSMAESESANT